MNSHDKCKRLINVLIKRGDRWMIRAIEAERKLQQQEGHK